MLRRKKRRRSNAEIGGVETIGESDEFSKTATQLICVRPTHFAYAAEHEFCVPSFWNANVCRISEDEQALSSVCGNFENVLQTLRLRRRAIGVVLLHAVSNFNWALTLIILIDFLEGVNGFPSNSTGHGELAEIWWPHNLRLLISIVISNFLPVFFKIYTIG